MTTLWWIRRDLRLTDNQALQAALAAGESVVPVFILDPILLHSPMVGEKRLAFLYAGLRELDTALQKLDSRLIVRRGAPVDVLAQLMAETGATGLFAEADYSPYAIRRDRAIAQALPLSLVGGTTVFSPDAVRKADGSPYTVYTPYSKQWKALPPPDRSLLLPAPQRILTPLDLPSLPIPDRPALPAASEFPPGEFEARRRLRAFADGPIFDYASGRNQLDVEGTSGLSPYLRFGMLSAREAVVVARERMAAASTNEAQRGAEVWLNELIWRDFYVAILYHFPHVLQGSFQPAYDHIHWRNASDDFAAWCDGRTGFPVVDASMRQLAATGWIHNRARMLVASFLVKDLLIDWRWGERWFMQHLLDGDPAANNGGWQWTAGTGTDAAPYFRVFNPVLQGARYDPDGTFIRRWLPELARVPDTHIHEPWKMPAAVQEAAGCVIGRDYPAPMVDHHAAREDALAAYAHARSEHAA